MTQEDGSESCYGFLDAQKFAHDFNKNGIKISILVSVKDIWGTKVADKMMHKHFC